MPKNSWTQWGYTTVKAYQISGNLIQEKKEHSFGLLRVKDGYILDKYWLAGPVMALRWMGRTTGPIKGCFENK